MKQNIKKGRYLFYDGEVYDLGGGDDGQAMAKAEEALAAAQAAQQTADEAQTAADGKAPIYHASEDNTYGVGDYLHYGHVKLADTPNASQQAGDGYAATPAAVQSAIDAMGWDLLWTNASPTSQFAAQTLSVSGLSNYSFLLFLIRNHKNDAYGFSFMWTSRLSGIGAMPLVAPWVAYRLIIVNGNTVEIGNNIIFKSYNSYSNAVTYNDFAIPVAIYGLKGGAA